MRISAYKQRALLAALLIDANHAVPVDRLIDALWRARPPDDAGAAVQVLVSQLRRRVDPQRSVLVTRPGAYELRVDEDALDAARFAAAAARGRRALEDGAAAAALRELQGALALWRGPALADFADEPFAQAEIGRLEELRTAAIGDANDARLCLGDHAALVGDLRSLVLRQPRQERFRAQLMLALYRCGRQAEALEEYQAARRTMVEELGIEPSPYLQHLQRAILAHDSALELAKRDPVPAVRAAAPAVVTRSRWTRPAIAALVLPALAAGVAMLARGPEHLGGAAATGEPAGDALVGLDRDGRVMARIPVGAGAASVATGAGAVWVLNTDDRTVSRVDPRIGRVVQTFATGEIPTELAADAGGVWVGSGFRAGTTRSSNALTQAFTHIEAASGRIVGTIRLPRPRAPDPRPGRVPGSVSAVTAFGALWAIAPDYSVVRINARTNRIVATIPVRASAVAAGADGIWALEWQRPRLVRIDPGSNTVRARIPLPYAGNAIAAGDGAVWMTEPLSAEVLRVQPGRRPLLRRISVGLGASAVAVAPDGVWVGNVLDDSVTVLDPQTQMVRRVIPVAFPQHVVTSGGAVWVTSRLPGLRSCGPVVYRGPGAPDRVIVSDLPLQAQGAEGVGLRRAADAVEFLLARHGFRAGRFRVGYRSCDDSTAAAGSWDIGRCLGNAKGYAADPRVIGVIGPNNSECAQVEIALTNRSPSGPVPIVSGWNTYSGLTRGGPDADRVLYPSGRRHFFRVVAQDHAQSAAGARLAADLGARRVYVLHSLDSVGQDLADAFPAPARTLGLTVAGSRTYGPASDLRRLAGAIRRAHADTVYIGARFNERGAELVRALRARLGRREILIAPDIFLGVPDLLRGAGAAARGVYFTAAGLPDQRLPAAGRRFLAAFDATREPETDVWPPASHGAAAAEALLAALTRSNGTRASVVQALHALRLRDGLLGEESFDRLGDTVEPTFGVWRVVGPATARTARAPVLRGAVLDRVVRVSGT